MSINGNFSLKLTKLCKFFAEAHQVEASCRTHVIQKKDAEDAVVNRVPELKKLSEDIDKATNTWINATLQLESAIQQYQRCERKLDSTVTDIRGKVDSINTHITNVLKDAPSKLKVSVNVADADWQKIQDLFDQEHK